MPVMMLVSALLALFGGPLLDAVGHLERRAHAFVDGFVFVTVAGLVLVGLLPEAVATMGPAALGFAAAGFLALVALEYGFVRTAPGAHSAMLLLALAALVLHQLLDGVALHLDAEATMANGTPLLHDDDHDHDHAADGSLTLAIALHNIPLGIAVWFLAARAWGTRLALLVLAALAGTTAAGYALGPRLLAALASPALNAFQAFLAGSILHVVAHGGLATRYTSADPASRDPVIDDRLSPTPVAPRLMAERLGTLAGLALLALWW
jgi:uncharacterized protein